MEEIEYLCVWAYKRRSGWAGGRLLGSVISKRRNKLWELRSVVVVGHTLSYYETGTEDSNTPRGKIDLWADQASFQIQTGDQADGAPTQHQIFIQAHVHQQGPQLHDHVNGDTASVEINSTSNSVPTTLVEWKLCFDSQEDLMRLVSVLNTILDKGGAFAQKDLGRFEHQFAKGDHIYRWEMIVCPPVIYPIQIHAIVLEAGRNCLVVADFGLTGYAKKKTAQFHHAEDNEDAMQEKILAAWRKLRPRDSTQRLNILTLTDPVEIRKWIKAGYDEESMLAKAKAAHKHHIPLDKLFKKSSPSSGSRNRKMSSSSLPNSWMKIPPLKLQDLVEQESDMFPKLYRTDDEGHKDKPQSPGEAEPSEFFPKLYRTDDEIKNELTQEESSEGESSHDEDSDIKLSSSLASRDDESSKTAKKPEDLPHSDPVEIVLARANFVLENMEVLPPYHVFFSNSECIAVWCKTGRWSTLQTAVWCSTNSVGALKTSTLTTIGVAATNPLLAPVIAIGGLLWVTAPMLILQKSRVAWEEYTQKMTELFWDWAPPIVYVSAIENWTIILQQKAIQEAPHSIFRVEEVEHLTALPKKDASRTDTVRYSKDN